MTSISTLFATGDYTVPAEKSNPAIDNVADAPPRKRDPPNGADPIRNPVTIY